MNCLSCDGVLEEVYGQSHHCCRSCNVYQFPNGLDEGLVPITSCGQTTSFLCPKCEVCLEVGSITDSVQVFRNVFAISRAIDCTDAIRLSGPG